MSNSRGTESGNALATTKRSAELATAGAAAAAKARIEAAYTVAMHRPRDLDTVRVRLLDAVKRPGFAQAALYAKPVGGTKIKGLSVRFAEEAARAMGNIQSDAQTVYDDDYQRIVQVTVTDLETNYTASKQVTIDKTVERKSSKGREVLGERTNSDGSAVYIVRATEDELDTKTNASVSKAKRNLLLDMLPGDITAEARAMIEKALRGEIEADPAAARKKVADAFAAIGVSPLHLKEYLGHGLDSCSPAEIQDLRDLHAAIKGGETTWAEVLRGRQEARDDAVPDASPAQVPEPEEPDHSGDATKMVEVPAAIDFAALRIEAGELAQKFVGMSKSRKEGGEALAVLLEPTGAKKVSEVGEGQLPGFVETLRAAVAGLEGGAA